MMEKIRVGIVGPGRIVSRVMKDFHLAERVELVAVASRSLERAQEAAKAYGAKYAFGSYEELAACDEVDLAYIATPHPFHCVQAMLMMEHGKHVLCEKPISISARQTRMMIDCARQNHVFLMEGMWSRCFPAYKAMKEAVRSGEIGDIRHVYALFSFPVNDIDPESRLFNPALAGGALLDVGVYPLMAATDLLGYEPEKVQCLHRLTETQVDASMSLQLQYASGATAQLMTGIDTFAPSVLHVYGTEGYVTVDNFWHADSFTVVKPDGTREERKFTAWNEGFFHEFDEAAHCIECGLVESPLMTHGESLAVSALCDRLRHEAGVYYPGE